MNAGILKSTDANFNEIPSSDKPVSVYFGAQWRGPGIAIALDQLAASPDSKVNIAKLNLDENHEKLIE